MNTEGNYYEGDLIPEGFFEESLDEALEERTYVIGFRSVREAIRSGTLNMDECLELKERRLEEYEKKVQSAVDDAQSVTIYGVADHLHQTRRFAYVRVWSSAYALVEYLYEEWWRFNDEACRSHFDFSTLPTLRTLELGAGCGLSGLSLSQLQLCRHCTLTDIDKTVLETLQRNLELTKATTANVEKLEWGVKEHIEKFAGRFDFLFGTDITYNQETIPLLLQTIHSLFSPTNFCHSSDKNEIECSSSCSNMERSNSIERGSSASSESGRRSSGAALLSFSSPRFDMRERDVYEQAEVQKLHVFRVPSPRKGVKMLLLIKPRETTLQSCR